MSDKSDDTTVPVAMSGKKRLPAAQRPFAR